MSGNHTVQNAQTRSLSKKYNLTNEQQETLHDLIHGHGYGYHEIETIIKETFNK